jgi:peptidoglycan/LPS O-acetylase OafA/YrhL
MPVWLAGVIAYRASQRLVLAPKAAAWVFVATSICLLVVVAMDSRGHFVRTNAVHWPGSFSSIDYLLGALMAGNIYAASFLKLPLNMMAGSISKAAGITFALYLLHLPILHLASAYMPSTWPVLVRGVILTAVALLAVIALSFVTEKRKREWRGLFRRLFSHRAEVASA